MNTDIKKDKNRYIGRLATYEELNPNDIFDPYEKRKVMHPVHYNYDNDFWAIWLKLQSQGSDYNEKLVKGSLKLEKLPESILKIIQEIRYTENAKSLLQDLTRELATYHFTFNIFNTINGLRASNIELTKIKNNEINSGTNSEYITIPLSRKLSEAENPIEFIKNSLYYLESFGQLVDFNREFKNYKNLSVIGYKSKDSYKLVGPILGNLKEDKYLYPKFGEEIYEFTLSPELYSYIEDKFVIHIEKNEFLRIIGLFRSLGQLIINKKDLRDLPDFPKPSISLFRPETRNSTYFFESEPINKEESIEKDNNLIEFYNIENENQNDNKNNNDTESIIISEENKVIVEEETSTYNNNNESNLFLNPLEDNLISNLLALAYQKELYYNIEDLLNFHTAIKTGSLVILSGKSGTGKSKLAELYADAVGGKFKLIPVKPSWNDNNDLLGFYDYNRNVYREDENNLIGTLIEANNNPDQLYFICLDEMNLSRVEHYFSKFLSILETDNKELPLFNSNFHPINSIKPVIRIGENIKFIGTVNIDESTYNFSDKVLDRSNIISLEILDFRSKEGWKKRNLKYKEFNWTTKDYIKLVRESKRDENVREFLWDLNLVLKEKNFEFGPRVVVAVEKYLSNLPSSLKSGKALDFQVVQRILTKLRGPEEAFEDLFDQIEAIFEKYSSLSLFTNSKEILKKKKKEMKVYGFTR